LDQLNPSLRCQLLKPVWSIELIHKPHEYIGIDFVSDRIDHTLYNYDISDGLAFGVEADLDFNLINFAIVVHVIVQKLKSWS
jgi:hypothetical protein